MAPFCLYGDPETAIQVLQRNLNFCYGTKLAVDGISGPKTRSALRLFQQQSGLPADGHPTAESVRRLQQTR